MPICTWNNNSDNLEEKFFLNSKISYDSKIFFILIVFIEFTFNDSYFLSNKSKFNKNIYFDHKKFKFHFGSLKYELVPSSVGHLG